jgi:hypothetical protein
LLILLSEKNIHNEQVWQSIDFSVCDWLHGIGTGGFIVSSGTSTSTSTGSKPTCTDAGDELRVTGFPMESSVRCFHAVCGTVYSGSK